MAINVNSISQTYGRDVFTNRGMYCGKVEDVECDLKRFKVRSLIVKAAKGSYVSSVLAGRRGLIVPFSMVEAVGDVVIVKHITSPLPDDGVELPELKDIKK